MFPNPSKIKSVAIDDSAAADVLIGSDVAGKRVIIVGLQLTQDPADTLQVVDDHPVDGETVLSGPMLIASWSLDPANVNGSDNLMRFASSLGAHLVLRKGTAGNALAGIVYYTHE